MDKLPPDKWNQKFSETSFFLNSVTDFKILFNVKNQFPSNVFSLAREVSIKKENKKLHQYKSTEDCKFYKTVF